MSIFLPEGLLSQSKENDKYLKSPASLNDAINAKVILEARALVCDSEHNLTVDLGCMNGIIPKEECAMGISDGTTRDIAIISKVNKPVCFYVKKIVKTAAEPYAILSRREVQKDCFESYITHLVSGDVIKGRVTHLESFGCFVDVGCGIISLIPIDAISVSRISHPKDRFFIGQDILALVKGFGDKGNIPFYNGIDSKLCLTHKELLGSWEENAKNFQNGETVAGIIRSIESYGIFVELAPNLAGLAELRYDVKVGQQASVYIKSIIPEKMKIKLIIVDSFDADYPKCDYKYFINSGHIDNFKYSPACSKKVVETEFYTLP